MVQSNVIGNYATGPSDLGNSKFGIYVTGKNETIGGLDQTEGNSIRGNEGGIYISEPGTSILTNDIDSNNNAPIVNIGDAVDLNQFTPHLATVTTNQVTGLVYGEANSTYQVQFFSNPTNASGGVHGGEDYLGSGPSRPISPATPSSRSATWRSR